MPRIPITIRISESSQTYIADLAKAEGVSQGLVIRAMLSVGNEERERLLTTVRAMKGSL